MKLNQKGYMLVEIVLASVLAFGIAYYLLNLTYKFKNTNTDVQESIVYTNNKNVITKNIMNDLSDGRISSIPSSGTTYVNFILNKDDVEEGRRLEIITQNGVTTIKYGKWTSSTSYDEDDVSYYEKELNSILIVGDIDIDIATDANSVGITIPISSIYDDKKYDIKLFSFLSS